MYLIIVWYDIEYNNQIFVFESSSEKLLYEQLTQSQIVGNMFGIANEVWLKASDNGFESEKYTREDVEDDWQWSDIEELSKALDHITSTEIVKIIKKFKIKNVDAGYLKSPLFIIKEKSDNKIISKVIKSTIKAPVKKLTKSSISIAKNTIYVDGGMNKKTGDEAWASVVDGDGNDLISQCRDLLDDMKIKSVDLPVGKRDIIVAKFADVKSQQNNGAELLAMLAGLKIAISCADKSSKIKICGDSDLIIKYWSKNWVTAKTRAKMSDEKQSAIKECAELREIFETKYGGSICKIDGGDNLADLGYH